MALSGNFSTNKYSGSYGTCGLKLSWTATQSIVNNTSTISWVLTSVGSMSSSYYYKAGPVKVVIGGKTVLNTTSRFDMRGDGGYRKTGTVVINHNEDGSKSVSMSVNAAIYSASVNCKGSKTVTLDKINRYALIESATDFTDEGNPVVEYSNPAGGDLTSDIYIRLKWMNADGVTEESTSWSEQLRDSGGTYTFDLDSYRTALRAACPTSNVLSVTVDLKSTMNGTEYHDTKTIVMGIVNANPTSGAVTFADVNSTVTAITGSDQIIVQGQSTLRISSAASTALKGASIVKYSLNFNGVDTDITSNRYLDIVKPSFSGTYTATVTTTDSRGNTSTAMVSVTITAWTAPTAQCTLARVNGFETNTVLTVKGSISSVTGSSMSITEKHRIVGGTWSAAAAVSDNTPTTLALDNTKEWEVQVDVWDSFTASNHTIYLLTVGKGIPIMFIDTEMNSVGINAFPDDDDQLLINGHIKIDGVKLPHKFSGTEQKIGYWTNDAPIYEKTIELSSDVTVNANAWNNDVYTNSEEILILGGEAIYYGSGVYVNWGFMGIQSLSSDKKKVCLYNSRNSSCLVNILIIRYIKSS